jgi:hypothetical protein
MQKIRPWMIVTLLCLLYALWVVAVYEPLALVTLGSRYDEANGGSARYDGQFNYHIARDPSTAAPLIDVPAYRFQRILLPALALPFPDEAIPFAMLAVNLVALAAGTALLESLLVGSGVSRWYALAYGLTLGTFGAARLSLSEPLAYGLALGGMWAALRGRVVWSAVLFALAALAKETTLIMAAGVGLWLLLDGYVGVGAQHAVPLRTDTQAGAQTRHALPLSRRIARAVGFGAATLALFIGWQIMLYIHLGAFGVGSGGALATSFEAIPFMGVIRIVTEGALPVLAANGVGAFIGFVAIFAVIVGVFVLLPTVWGLLHAWRDLRAGQVTLWTWLLLATSAIMLFVPFSTYREPVGILRFIVGLQIAVIGYAAERRQRRALNYSLAWVLTVFFVVTSDL